ncbi:MAG: hypothetical protein QOI08_2258 [Actinomycetota bacterium]|jgi:uncharacterized protein YkwD|nr:hypothetical protein [Actinomycetota bacterium]
MFRVAVAVLFAAVSAAPAGDPPQSIQPTPAFAQACYGKPRPTTACDTQAIANINSARAAEGVGPIALPGDYSSLTLNQKMIAVSNAERTARGIPAVVERAKYDRLAKQGAVASTDPIGPSGHAWGSIWAGVADPLAADFL